MERNIEKLTKSSKEVEEVETDQFEKINMGDHDENFEPFTLLGRAGEYTLTLGNTAVWDKKIVNVEEATTLLTQKPWKLILIASKVYGEYVNEYIKKINK